MLYDYAFFLYNGILFSLVPYSANVLFVNICFPLIKNFHLRRNYERTSNLKTYTIVKILDKIQSPGAFQKRSVCYAERFVVSVLFLAKFGVL